MMLSQPGDQTYAAEVRELASHVAAEKLSHSRRVARNSPFIHPDARQPDDEPEEQPE